MLKKTAIGFDDPAALLERIVGLVKNSLYKVVGLAKLTYKELQGVLLDIVLNSRHLTYCEDDVHHSVLTPNDLILGKANYLLDLPTEEIEEGNLGRRAKYLNMCNDALWHHLGEEKNRSKWKMGVMDKLIPEKDGIARAVRLRTGITSKDLFSFYT